MDYFLQVLTIAYSYTLTAYSSIKLYKLGQAHFFPSSNLNFDKIKSNMNLSFPTYIFTIFSQIQISASLGKNGLGLIPAAYPFVMAWA